MIDCISRIRNNDIINAYYDSMKSVLHQNSYAKRCDIINDILIKNAPRFYTTFEYARRYVSMINRGLSLPVSDVNKVEMYKEIYKRYKDRCPYGDDYASLRDIIMEPAPSFYLSYWRISGIIYKKLRKE